MIRKMTFIFSMLIFFTPNMNCISAGVELSSENERIVHQYETYTQELQDLFDIVTKPKQSIFFFKSLRLKKYETVKKNLGDFKEYLTSLDLKNKKIQGAEIMAAYEILHDKILWIDGFKTANLKHFSSPYYAERFFKTHDSIFNRKAEDHERKEKDE